MVESCCPRVRRDLDKRGHTHIGAGASDYCCVVVLLRFTTLFAGHLLKRTNLFTGLDFHFFSGNLFFGRTEVPAVKTLNETRENERGAPGENTNRNKCDPNGFVMGPDGEGDGQNLVKKCENKPSFSRFARKSQRSDHCFFCPCWLALVGVWLSVLFFYFSVLPWAPLLEQTSTSVY